MVTDFTRRELFHFMAGTGVAAGILRAQGSLPTGSFPTYEKRSKVALMHGDVRRKNVYDALKAIEDQIGPALKSKKYVVIKPNNVSTRNQLAASHADGLRGILDFLEPYKKNVVIAESSAGTTMDGFDNFGYVKLPAEYKWANMKLVDLNEEALYQLDHVLDANLHPTPVRLAKRLLDPDAFIISSAMLKTHNVAIATLSVKNMVLGAPLHQAPKETPRWNDKRQYHHGIRQSQYSMMLTAKTLKPFWGATVLDGFEGMEGNGPGSGTPVDHKIAIASNDFIAADRVGLEAMGIDPSWPGSLVFCSQVGLGQYDLSKIDVIGAELASVKKKYVMHADIERELKWMGEMTELPEKLG